MTKKTNHSFQKAKEQITQNLKNKYPYFLTGIVVVLLIFTFIWKNTKSSKVNISSSSIEVEKSQETKTVTAENKTEPKTYIVKAGDHLWKIAEAAYGSGYNAYDIARANNITNPSMVYVGQKLIIPSIEPKQLTRGEITSAKTTQVVKKADTYTVQTGDNLWDIAVTVYGDGFAWNRIAKLNNLENPGIIFKGQILKIE